MKKNIAGQWTKLNLLKGPTTWGWCCRRVKKMKGNRSEKAPCQAHVGGGSPSEWLDASDLLPDTPQPPYPQLEKPPLALRHLQSQKLWSWSSLHAATATRRRDRFPGKFLTPEVGASPSRHSGLSCIVINISEEGPTWEDGPPGIHQPLMRTHYLHPHEGHPVKKAHFFFVMRTFNIYSQPPLGCTPAMVSKGLTLWGPWLTPLQSMLLMTQSQGLSHWG